jgi:hypothetical protein
LIALLGLYGALSAAKLHERATYHLNQARALTATLRDVGRLADDRHVDEYRAQHYRAFPRLHRVRLHWLWTGLHLGVAAYGVGLRGDRVGDMTDEAGVPGEPRKLFVSYAGPDRDWARWVASRLRAQDLAVEVDTSWAAGETFVIRMNDALEGADQVICLFSASYFEPKRFSRDEWTAIVADRQRVGRLIPLRLEDVQPPAILRPLIYVDLFGCDQKQATQRLIRAVGGKSPRVDPPPFPGRR